MPAPAAAAPPTPALLVERRIGDFAVRVFANPVPPSPERARALEDLAARIAARILAARGD